MSYSHTFRRLLGLLSPYKSRIVVALIAMAITSATEPAVAALMKQLLDSGFVKGSFPVWLVPVIVIGLFLIR